MRPELSRRLLFSAGLLLLACAPEEQAAVTKVPLTACSTPPGHADHEAVETRCDGLDNDCDGHVDLLRPVPANDCLQVSLGACGKGTAACVDGLRVCLGPPPMPESLDGVDDDCDGVADDVAEVVLPELRARVIAPPYLWQEGGDTVLAVVEALHQQGLPLLAPSAAPADPYAQWATELQGLTGFPLVVLPGYVDASALSTWQIKALEQFVTTGGVLLWHEPVAPWASAPPSVQAQAQAVFKLAGITKATTRKDGTRLEIQANVPATWLLDSPEERQVLLRGPGGDEVKASVFEVDTASGAASFGTLFVGEQPAGATLVRRPLGKGVVYTFGTRLLGPASPRCVANCFDPGRDLYGLLVRGILREATRGHDVRKHTVPGLQDGVLLLTHDVATFDAWNPGDPWGEPGALQLARKEQALGVPATWFLTTDFVSGTYNPKTVKALCSLGACPDGARAVKPAGLKTLQLGTCPVTVAYDAAKPTLCAEVAASLQTLGQATGKVVRAWRSPYLDPPAQLFEVLAARGVRDDSSFTFGELRTNLPASGKRFPARQEVLQHKDVTIYPVGLRDVRWKPGQDPVELTAQNAGEFVGAWTYALLQNARNGAWSVAQISPARGEAADPREHVQATEKLVLLAKARGLLVERIEPLGEFWRGREAADVRASYVAGDGYAVTVKAGAVAAPRLTLEVADAIATASCDRPAVFQGKRLMFTEVLQPGQIVHCALKVQVAKQ